MSAWAYLGIAIALEIIATTLLKLSDGLARPGIATAAIATYIVCFLVMAPALKVLPLGVAYAIWCGVGLQLLTPTKS